MFKNWMMVCVAALAFSPLCFADDNEIVTENKVSYVNENTTAPVQVVVSQDNGCDTCNRCETTVDNEFTYTKPAIAAQLRRQADFNQ